MAEPETREYYQLSLPNFIESIIRVAHGEFCRRGAKEQPLSLVLESYVRRVDCSVVEGFALGEEVEEVQEVLEHYEEKLWELYERLKATAWSPLDYSCYFSFDKISFGGKLCLCIVEFYKFLVRMHIVNPPQRVRTDIIREESKETEETKAEEKKEAPIKVQKKIDISNPEAWEPYLVAGRKVFGNPFEPKDRQEFFKLSSAKAADFFVSCVDVVQHLRL